MKSLSRGLAPIALLSALLLTACGGAPPEPVVVRPTVPASLLVCHPEPPPPPQNADDVALGDYLVALADAGEDCRRNLSEVGKLVEH